MIERLLNVSLADFKLMGQERIGILHSDIDSLLLEGPEIASYLVVARAQLYSLVKSFAELGNSGAGDGVSIDQTIFVFIR
jgi:hypothetical protein